MTSLPTVAFGDTGYKITRVGFGAWAIGGGDWVMTWGETDDDVSVAAVLRAVESGVNWIDTAAVYGLGHSEIVVGRALAQIPEADRPYIFTKCGFNFDEHDRSKPTTRSGSAKDIRTQVENSLRRLGLERVDLYQMHWPPADGTPVEEYWQTMLDLVAEGKIGAPALSNHSPELLDRAEAIGHVSAIQPGLSAINRAAADDVLPWAAAHNTGSIVYSPQQCGLLTGAFTPERLDTLADDDFRRRNPYFEGDAFTANLALADALRRIGDRHGVTAGVVAIAWTLAFDGVTAAIVGARTPDQVEGWLPAASFELGVAELDEIAAAIEVTGAGDGPNHP